MKTSEVVLAVSAITSRSVFSVLNARQPLQAIPKQRPKTANVQKPIPTQSLVSVIVLMLRLKFAEINQINKIDRTAKIAG